MNIREARKSLGWTQRRLSEELNIPLRTIENWEGGKNKCPAWADTLIVEKLERIRMEEEEMADKKDLSTKIYKEVFNIDEDHGDVNQFMKAIIINFGDERGDIVVENDNFGTDEKYADFTEGKKKAGLHPMQIVFSGIESAKILHERYIDKDGNVQTF